MTSTNKMIKKKDKITNHPSNQPSIQRTTVSCIIVAAAGSFLEGSYSNHRKLQEKQEYKVIHVKNCHNNAYIVSDQREPH
jgi:hypothetical protein